MKITEMFGFNKSKCSNERKKVPEKNEVLTRELILLVVERKIQAYHFGYTCVIDMVVFKDVSTNEGYYTTDDLHTYVNTEVGKTYKVNYLRYNCDNHKINIKNIEEI